MQLSNSVLVNLSKIIIIIYLLFSRLYGFKIHGLAYQIQQQAAANVKTPLRLTSFNGKR